MKKLVFALVSLFLSIPLFSQTGEFEYKAEDSSIPSLLRAAGTVFKSSNGIGLPTQGRVRALSIFVNMIYIRVKIPVPIRKCYNCQQCRRHFRGY